jgi:transcriptional regulator with XRE-family HTH domain
VITASQLKAARALIGWEQRTLAEASGASLPTIQRMEASNGTVRGVIETLMKVMAALEGAGVEFINEGAVSAGGGRGVRLRNESVSARFGTPGNVVGSSSGRSNR